MKNIQFCIKSILIWVAIKGDDSKIPIRCPTQLDSTAYQAVLEEGLQDMYAEDTVFMQAGAPCHTSRSTMLYLEKKKNCLFSGWSLQSPDINVIKNMCSIMKTCIFQFNITPFDDFWNATDILIETLYNRDGKPMTRVPKADRPCLLSERGHRDLVILAKKSSFCGLLQLLEGAKSTRACLEAPSSVIYGSRAFWEERLKKNQCLLSNT